MPRDTREEIINVLETTLGIPPSTEEDLRLVDLQGTINSLLRTIRTNQEVFTDVPTVTIGENMPAGRNNALGTGDLVPYGQEQPPFGGYYWNSEYFSERPIDYTLQPKVPESSQEIQKLQEQVASLTGQLDTLKDAVYALINQIDGTGLY